MYTGVLATLKSYPTIGDYALWFSLLPLYANTWRYLRYTFVVMSMYVSSLVLVPIMHNLWVRFGSGNANFVYAMTLVIGTASAMFQSDLGHAMLMRLYHVSQVEKLQKQKDISNSEDQPEGSASPVISTEESEEPGETQLRHRGKKEENLKHETNKNNEITSLELNSTYLGQDDWQYLQDRPLTVLSYTP
jgi:phosphatidylinositol glycan class U